MFKNLKPMVMRAVVAGVVAVGAPVAAFAQTTGSGTTFDTTDIVASVNAVVPGLIAVGGAVLGVVAVAWGIKMVRTFLGR
jgi:Inovirus Coat protein B